MVGHRVEVIADLPGSGCTATGRLVVEHERLWARHQTVSDPAHIEAAKLLRSAAYMRINRVDAASDEFADDSSPTCAGSPAYRHLRTLPEVPIRTLMGTDKRPLEQTSNLGAIQIHNGR